MMVSFSLMKLNEKPLLLKKKRRRLYIQLSSYLLAHATGIGTVLFQSAAEASKGQSLHLSG